MTSRDTDGHSAVISTISVFVSSLSDRSRSAAQDGESCLSVENIKLFKVTADGLSKTPR